jgi:hypothetical protein
MKKRRWMIAMAIAAFALATVLWVARLRASAARYRSLALQYEISETLYANPSIGPPKPSDLVVVVRHVASLRRKHERAARYPWLPIEPDPPDPFEATKWGLKLTIDPDKNDGPVPAGFYGHPPRF